MKLLLHAIEQAARLLAEWAARRREVYVEPRFFPQAVKEAYDRPILRSSSPARGRATP